MNMISTIAPADSQTDLAARAMIVSLHISQWSGRRLDREVTDEVNSTHGAAADAGRYNKLLLPKEALAEIIKIVGETRNEFAKRTLPWMDGGGRIMAADAYMAHSAWMNRQKSKFERAVADFLAQYPGYVAKAQGRLSALYKDTDYPDVDELRGKFSMDTRVLPVPTGDDFRVAMSEAQAARIRADIEEQVAQATRIAVKDVYRRVADVTGRMVERLNAYRPAKGKGDKSEGIFRDSLVENVRDLIRILPALNITGDPQLTAMAEQLKPLAEYDAAVLRESDNIRRSTADKAKAIFDQVSDFI